MAKAKKFNNWFKSNRILSIVILVCIGFFIYYVVNAVSWIIYPNSIDYGEGFVMNYAKLWANGGWKWDITTPPYLTMVYGVGFPILAFPFVKIFGATLMVGRAISFASAIIACLFFYLIVKEILGRKGYALLASLLPATQPIFRDWSVMARVDMPAVMFDIIGFYLVVKFKNNRWVYLSIIPFLFALMTKMTAIAGLIAVIIYLLIYQRKRVWSFVGFFVIVLIAVMTLLMIASDGTYWKHIILYQNTIQYVNWGQFLFLFNRLIYPFLMLLILSILYIKNSWNKRQFTLFSLFFVSAFVIDIFFTLKPGAAGMYYLELIMVGCLCFTLALPYFILWIRKHHLQPQNAVIITVLVALFFVYSIKHDIEPPDKEYTESISRVESIISDSDRPIITENPAIALNVGKDLYIEYFIFANLARLGYWDETPYVEKYNEQYFDYVLLRISLEQRLEAMGKGEKDGDFTDDAIRAMDKNYTLIYKSENRYWIYSLFLYEANNKLAEDNDSKNAITY